MTRTSKLNRVRDDFIYEVGSATGLAEEVGLFRDPQDQSVRKALSHGRIGQISELSFLKIMLSLEVLLERSLVLYLMDEKTDSGYQPCFRIGKARNETVAYQLLSGRLNFNVENDYIDNLKYPHQIKQAADFFFTNHSYRQLSDKTKSILINHAWHIRNHIAHNSKSSKKKFDTVAKDLIKINSSCKVSELLLSPVKQHFTRTQIQKQWTHLESYSLLFIDLAHKIIPGK